MVGSKWLPTALTCPRKGVRVSNGRERFQSQKWTYFGPQPMIEIGPAKEANCHRAHGRNHDGNTYS